MYNSATNIVNESQVKKTTLNSFVVELYLCILYWQEQNRLVQLNYIRVILVKSVLNFVYRTQQPNTVTIHYVAGYVIQETEYLPYPTNSLHREKLKICLKEGGKPFFTLSLLWFALLHTPKVYAKN